MLLCDFLVMMVLLETYSRESLLEKSGEESDRGSQQCIFVLGSFTTCPQGAENSLYTSCQ